MKTQNGFLRGIGLGILLAAISFLLAMFVFTVRASAQTLPTTAPVTQPVYMDISPAITGTVPGQTITLAGGGYYAIHGAVIRGANVRILGDPSNHAHVRVDGVTGITVMGDAVEIGNLDYSGTATFVLTKSSHPFIHDCRWIAPAWYGISLAGGTSDAKILRCGGITHEYGVYVDAGVTRVLIQGCFGGSTDQHPSRCSGGTFVTWLDCTYDSIGNKEAIAARKGDYLWVISCTLNGPVLFGEGAGSGVPSNVTHGLLSGCLLYWNKLATVGIGCQAEARSGADVDFIRNDFYVTEASQQPADIGPSSHVTLRGNRVWTPTGQLAKAHWITNRGTILGNDDTVLAKTVTGSQ